MSRAAMIVMSCRAGPSRRFKLVKLEGRGRRAGIACICALYVLS